MHQSQRAEEAQGLKSPTTRCTLSALLASYVGHMGVQATTHVLCLQADVEQTAEVIREACNGFVQFLLQLKGKCADGAAFRTALQDEVRNMQDIDWLKPPMLSKA